MDNAGHFPRSDAEQAGRLLDAVAEHIVRTGCKLTDDDKNEIGASYGYSRSNVRRAITIVQSKQCGPGRGDQEQRIVSVQSGGRGVGIE